MKLRSVKTRVRRAAGCQGKERFTSFTRAQQVASRTSHRRSEALQAYSCGFCGGFHVGTKSGNDRGLALDSRQPYRVYAHNGDGVECFIGRSNQQDGGKLAEILRKDGWTVTRVV